MKGKTLDVVGVVFFSSLTLGCAALGSWQVSRYNWKVNLIKNSKHSLHRPPVKLESKEIRELGEEIQIKGDGRIIITGEYDHENVFLLGPRSSPLGLSSNAQGMSTNPQGYNVIAPLKLENGDKVFINRGWVPSKGKEWSRPSGKVEVICLPTKPEKKSIFSPKNETESKRLYWLEEAALRSSLPTDSNYPVLLFTAFDSSTEQKKIQFPYASRIETYGDHHVTPEIHAAYAFTWFSLSLAGIIMTYQKFKGRSVLKPKLR